MLSQAQQWVVVNVVAGWGVPHMQTTITPHPNPPTLSPIHPQVPAGDLDAVHAAVAQRAGAFQAEYGDKEKGLKIAAVPSHQQGPGVPHPQVGMGIL